MLLGTAMRLCKFFAFELSHLQYQLGDATNVGSGSDLRGDSAEQE